MTNSDMLPDPSRITPSACKDTRSAATALAEAGFKVLRLPPGKKAPPPKGWATSPRPEPSAIARSWPESGDDSPDQPNIGIQTGHGFVVLDFDPKCGGADSFQRMMALGDLPYSFTVRTQSGGFHVYLAHPHRLANGTGVLDHAGYPGVDLRAHHGYVVGPGSIVGGNTYTIHTAEPIAPLTEFLANALSASRPATPADQTPVVELDTDEAIDLATDWLLHKAPEAVENARGDDTTAKLIAPKLKDFGLSADMAVELALEHWNNRKAIPPWDPDDLEKKIRSGYNSAKGSPPGIELLRQPHREFDPLPPAIVAAVEESERRRTSKDGTRESKPIKPATPITIERWSEVGESATEWLIDGVLPVNGLGALYGQPGAYKSFLALYLAAMTGANQPFLDRKTNPPPSRPDVIYIAAEGGSGLKKRLDAIHRIHGVAPNNVAFIRHTLDLRSSKTDATALVQAVNALRLRPCLLVIDTLARTFGGGNENSSEDMGAFIGITDHLREKLNSAVLLVHHSGKDQAKGMRGHSALFGAVDSELEAAKIAPAPQHGEGTGAGKLTVTKQKDGPDGWSADYAVQRVLFDGHGTGTRESGSINEGDAEGWADRPPATERASLAVRPWGENEARAVQVEEIKVSALSWRVLDVVKAQCALGGGSVSRYRLKQTLAEAGVAPGQWLGARKELVRAGAIVSSEGRNGWSLGAAFQEVGDEIGAVGEGPDTGEQ